MPLTFPANVSMLFTELPFLDRVAAAKHAGSGAVDFLVAAVRRTMGAVLHGQLPAHSCEQSISRSAGVSLA